MVRALALCAVLSGCSVDRKILDTGVFSCETDHDCLVGYGCLDLRPYGEPFCAPEYDESCLGARTAGGLCVESCTVGGEECRAGFTCVRGFLPADPIPAVEDREDTGWCLPVDTCDSTNQCAGGEICLSEYASKRRPDGKSPLDNDALVCMPTCENDGDCDGARGEVCSSNFDDGGAEHVCLPPCDAEGVCPPLFTCFDMLEPTGIDPFCIPGAFLYLPCQDDLGCLVAECIEAGGPGQKTCTFEGCAPSGAFPCFNAPVYIPPDAPTGLQCIDGACVGVLQQYLPCTGSIPCGGENVCGGPPGIRICTQHCPLFTACPDNPDGTPGYCDERTNWCLPDAP
jgi:hypothetical protein